MNANHHLQTTGSNHVFSGGTKKRVLLIEALFSRASGNLQKKLNHHHFELLAISKTVESLHSLVRQHRPEVLMLSVDFLDAQTLDQLIKLNQSEPLPVVVFANKHDPQVLEAIVVAGISSYVVDDIQAHRLPVIVDLAIARYDQIRSLNLELENTKEKLSERKVIERAKGIIMKQKRLSESEAYSQMRKSAMDQGQSIAELAKRIIAVFDMLD